MTGGVDTTDTHGKTGGAYTLQIHMVRLVVQTHYRYTTGGVDTLQIHMVRLVVHKHMVRLVV